MWGGDKDDSQGSDLGDWAMIIVHFTERVHWSRAGTWSGEGYCKGIHDAFICRHAKFVVSALSDVHGEDLYEDDSWMLQSGRTGLAVYNEVVGKLSSTLFSRYPSYTNYHHNSSSLGLLGTPESNLCADRSQWWRGGLPCMGLFAALRFSLSILFPFHSLEGTLECTEYCHIARQLSISLISID